MANELLKIVPTIMAIDLLEYNIRKKKRKNIVRQGVTNIVGLSMINEVAKFTG